MTQKQPNRLTAGRQTELSLLREIRARAVAVTGAVRLGIGDDCALLRLRPGEEVAVTTDLSIAGRHFRLDWHAPESVGHRTFARGLSDLASMGARPVAAFVSLGLPPELTRAHGRGSSWISRFYDGLLALAQEFDTPLAGGDLAESPIAVADIVLVGAVPRGMALVRSGARPGDLLYVSGSLGGAAAGLAKLAAAGAGSAEAKSFKIPAKLAPQLAAHLYPQPRVFQGMRLRRLASAAIDISDGLSTDLAHLCEESGVAAEVDAGRLPLGHGATLAQALHGGEDYELLFTARPSARIPRSIAGIALHQIGRILRPGKERAQVTLRAGQGTEPLEPRGWEHFA